MGGHIGGGFWDAPDGQRWYVKTEKSEALARNEALANSLYKVAGATVPDMEIEGATIRTKAMPNAMMMSDLPPARQKIAGDAIKPDWAADGWLGNWDVHEQNILIDKDDPTKHMRIDPGGALDFWGMGGPKRDRGLQLTTNTAEEEEWRHIPSMKNLTNAEVAASTDKLIKNVSREKVAQAVAQYGPKDPIAQRNLTNLLMRRRNNVIELAADKAGYKPPVVGTKAERMRERRLAFGGKMVSTYLPSDKNLQDIKNLDAYFGGFRGAHPNIAVTFSNKEAAENIAKFMGKPGDPTYVHDLLASVSDYKVVDARGQPPALQDLVNSAKKDYYPGVIVENASIGGKTQTVLINMDGPLLRSIGAEFNLGKMHLQDLLASGTAITIGAGLGSMLVGEAKAAQPESNQPIIVRAGKQMFRFPAGTPDETINKALREEFERQKVPESKSPYDVGGKPGQELRAAEELYAREHPEESYTGHMVKRVKQDIEDIKAGYKGLGTEAEPGVIRHGQPVGFRIRGEPGKLVSGALDLPMTVLDPASRYVEKNYSVPQWMTETALTLGAPLLLKRVNPLSSTAWWKTGSAGSLAQAKELQKIISDDLFKIRNWHTADKAEMLQFLKTVPPEFRNPTTDARLYRALERPELVHQLPPGEQPIFNKYVLPMREEIQRLSQAAGDYKFPLDDDQWVHRVLSGQEPLPHETLRPDLPLGQRTLPRKTGAMMHRNFFVLEDPKTGERFVASTPTWERGKVSYWNKGTPMTEDTNQVLRPGEVFSRKGRNFIVKEALTDELEQHTNFRFQKSAFVNMADALVKMRATVRNIKYLDMLTQTPEWNKFATKNPIEGRKAGWDRTQMPQLDEWYMHPKLKGALDDFFQPGLLKDNWATDQFRRFNRFATGTMFWQPVPHVFNVLGHWGVGRGWDWALPGGWKSLFLDGAKAIKSVVTLDDNYKRLLKEGNALIYGGVHNQDFYRQMGKQFGLHISRNAGWIDRLNKALGPAAALNPAQWARVIYDGSNRVMWAANDIMMMQRVLELERKGYKTKAAIAHAEKHIPNYRIPPEVLGNRMVSQAMQDPALFNFGRYHYGMLNSYMNMLKDLLGPTASMQERVDAAGNMMALAMLVYYIYPALDSGFQKLFGDSDVKMLRRGPATIPDIIGKMSTGEKHLPDLIGSIVTLAPAWQEGVQLGFNRDFFTGKPIWEPGEPSYARMGSQILEHATSKLFTPYNQGRQVMQALDEKGAPREAVKQIIGLEDKTAKQVKGFQRGQKLQRAEAKTRRKRPAGPIEEYLPGIFGD
jgi:hypothetical protein